MATTKSKAFERVFSTKDLFRGKTRSAIIWSALGSLFLCLLLFDFYLISDLLENRGRLVVPDTSAEEIAALTGSDTDPSGQDIRPAVVVRDLIYERSGILPAVWRDRDTFWGFALAASYRQLGPLRDNGGALLTLILVAVGLVLIRSLFMARARVQTSRAALEVVTRLRRSLHRQTLRLGPGDLMDSSGQQILTLFTSDMDHVSQGVRLWILRLGRDPVLLALLLLLALSTQWRVALQCLIPLFLCWYLIQLQRRSAGSARRLAEDRTQHELRLLAESLRKTRMVRGYGMENLDHAQFHSQLERFSRNVSNVERVERWSHWASLTLVTFTVAIVAYLVGIKVLQYPGETEGLSMASALLLLATFAFMHRPLDKLWRFQRDCLPAVLAAERIHRYLGQIPEVGQAVGAKFLQPLSKSLQFEAVSYSLPDKTRLLDRIDLKVSAGETVAIVGMNPLESRAMAYMIPRFIEPQSGQILIDGEDIAWVTLESLRAEAIYVGGTDPFFTGTVRENISCGNADYSLQDITEAAKESHAHNFIVKLPQGYETVLGEHGEQLDAGQGFRLSLARALLRNPALLIIEEPVETLDVDTKSMLDDAYNRVARDRTVLFLPTRLSTLRRADRVVFLHVGKVEAIGPHAELLKSCPRYRHWEYLLFNEFRNESA